MKGNKRSLSREWAETMVTVGLSAVLGGVLYGASGTGWLVIGGLTLAASSFVAIAIHTLRRFIRK